MDGENTQEKGFAFIGTDLRGWEDKHQDGDKNRLCSRRVLNRYPALHIP
jgi:putative N-acetylmannosamine-6-phosphate epimerase